LAVRLAGIYSLAALADDWAENGNEDERQVCIDLLCAYFRSQSDENASTRKELVDATVQVVQERVGLATAKSKNWGSTRINLVRPGILPMLGPLRINEKGLIAVEEALVIQRRIGDVEVNGGVFRIGKIRNIRRSLTIAKAHVLNGGKIEINLRPRSSEEPQPQTPPSIMFQGLKLEKGILDLKAMGAQVVFSSCVFEEGASMDVEVADNSGPHRGRVSFKNCTFRTNVFADEDWAPGEDLLQLRTDFLNVDSRCKFENGAARLESFSPESPED
jgi:hypothetical protein